MPRSKKIFLFAAVIFFGVIIYLCYDFSRRTTFPGSKPQLKEGIQDQFLRPDSTKKDTIITTQR